MGQYEQIKSQRLKKLLNEGVVLVDIRRQDEWKMTGIVAGSVLLTFFYQTGAADPADWLQQLHQQVPIEAPLALICRSGYRTNLVCDFLCQTSPRDSLYNVAGGILGWLAAGLPVVPAADQAGLVS